MKLTARGDTDAANIVLFWPANLPEDGDAQLNADPMALLEKLREEGKLLWFPAAGDGYCTAAFFIDEKAPTTLAGFCQAGETIPRLEARGPAWFGGTECVFKSDAQFVEKHPHMATAVAIPPGVYAALVQETAYPAGFIRSWIREQAGALALGLYELQGLLIIACFLGIVAAVITVFFLAWRTWFFVVGALGAMMFMAFAVSRIPSYRRAIAAQDEMELQYPTYVVHLSRID